MDSLRQYVISVVVVSLICGIISGLIQNGVGKQQLRFLCGIILAITAIRPLTRMEYPDFNEEFFAISQEGKETASLGESMAKEKMAQIIKAEIDAYILDIAMQLHVEITPEVVLDQDLIPKEVSVHGEISPFARQKLERILISDLGLTKENLIWVG